MHRIMRFMEAGAAMKTVESGNQYHPSTDLV
jgi:hypothetical protein